MVTWIANPDDLHPDFLVGIERKMTEIWEEQAARFGWRFRFIMATEVVPGCTDGRPRLWHRGEDLLATRQCYIVDDVAADGQAAHFLEGVYRTVEASDSVLLNRALAAPDHLERDKLSMVQWAAGLGFPVPRTVALPFGRYARSAVQIVREEIGDGPYIVKGRGSGTGFGVLRVDTVEQLSAATDVIAQSGRGYIVQEYLPNHGDLRVLWVNDRFAASLLRRPTEGRYLSNVAQGGDATANPDYAAVEEHCLRAVRALGAQYLSVDWLLTPDGPVFGEWGTAMSDFSSCPEPARSQLAEAFFEWADRRLTESATRSL